MSFSFFDNSIYSFITKTAAPALYEFTVNTALPAIANGAVALKESAQQLAESTYNFTANTLIPEVVEFNEVGRETTTAIGASVVESLKATIPEIPHLIAIEQESTLQTQQLQSNIAVTGTHFLVNMAKAVAEYASNIIVETASDVISATVESTKNLYEKGADALQVSYDFVVALPDTVCALKEETHKVSIEAVNTLNDTYNAGKEAVNSTVHKVSEMSEEASRLYASTAEEVSRMYTSAIHTLNETYSVSKEAVNSTVHKVSEMSEEASKMYASAAQILDDATKTLALNYCDKKEAALKTLEEIVNTTAQKVSEVSEEAYKIYDSTYNSAAKVLGDMYSVGGEALTTATDIIKTKYHNIKVLGRYQEDGIDQVIYSTAVVGLAGSFGLVSLYSGAKDVYNGNYGKGALKLAAGVALESLAVFEAMNLINTADAFVASPFSKREDIAYAQGYSDGEKATLDASSKWERPCFEEDYAQGVLAAESRNAMEMASLQTTHVAEMSALQSAHAAEMAALRSQMTALDQSWQNKYNRMSEISSSACDLAKSASFNEGYNQGQESCSLWSVFPSFSSLW